MHCISVYLFGIHNCEWGRPTTVFYAPKMAAKTNREIEKRLFIVKTGIHFITKKIEPRELLNSSSIQMFFSKHLYSF